MLLVEYWQVCLPEEDAYNSMPLKDTLHNLKMVRCISW
jgi:hypothetical protein